MISFTETQNKAIAAGLTAVSLALVLAFVACIAWGALNFISFASPALIPVLVGFFLALFFRPYYRLCLKTFRNPSLALVVMLATVIVPFSFLLWYAGAVLVDQLSNLVSQGPALFQQVNAWFRTTFPKLHGLFVQMGVPYEDLGAVYTKYGMTALKAGTGALKYLSAIVTGVVSIIFFIFFLTTKERKGSEVLAHVPFLKRETQEFLGLQVDAFFEILVSFFQRQAVICIIEGLLYGGGFALVGLPYGFLLGFTLGILNLIPLFGSIVCLPVALPLAYFTHDGSLTRLLLVLGVWACGQVLDGYFITPKIQGDKTGLGYAGVIFSFVFWATLLGPLLGMFLAIPLSAFCVVLWRAVKARYIRPVV